mgnify:CR=1 FL=1
MVKLFVGSSEDLQFWLEDSYHLDSRNNNHLFLFKNAHWHIKLSLASQFTVIYIIVICLLVQGLLKQIYTLSRASITTSEAIVTPTGLGLVSQPTLSDMDTV